MEYDEKICFLPQETKNLPSCWNGSADPTLTSPRSCTILAVRHTNSWNLPLFIYLFNHNVLCFSSFRRKAKWEAFLLSSSLSFLGHWLDEWHGLMWCVYLCLFLLQLLNLCNFVLLGKGCCGFEKLAVGCAHSASGLHHFNLVRSLPDKKGKSNIRKQAQSFMQRVTLICSWKYM